MQDEDRLARSLAAVELVGRFIGGTVKVESPTPGTPVWGFEWQAPEGEQSPQWLVPLEQGDVLEESYAAVEVVTEFLGGAFTIGAVREERGGEYETTARAFLWKSYLPALKPVPEAEPEPEPAAVAG